MSVFNTEKTADQYGESPLFFGTAPGLFDTINKVYPEIWDLYKEMKKLDWSEDEFDYSQCNIDFKTVHRPTAEKMKKTLIYQWEQDSVAARAIAPVLAPFITNSELWAMYQRISDNECLVPEHEVLTKDRGWVQIADIKVGDTVAQYNPHNGKTEFAVVSNTVSRHYAGDIITFCNHNATFRQRVTPGHRMVTRRLYGPNQGHEFHEASVCPKNGSMAFIVSGEMIGGDDALSAKDRPRGNRKDQYQVNVTDISYVAGNTVKSFRDNYEGMVHCITVPSGAFLTRIDGIISVTGNCIHAATYSEIVRMSFDDPKAVLVETLEMKETIQRMEVILGIMDDLAEASHKYALGLIPADQELFNKLYLFVVALFIMERVQFMASFGVTFTICASGPFQPIGQAVKKIAQDEFEVHVQAGKAVLKILHNTEMGRIAREQTKATVESIFAAVVNSEFTFIDWLFSDGEPMIGTNADLLKKWVLFCGKDPVTFLGLKHPFGKLPKENPMPHLEKWIDMNKLQAAPMEQDHGQYKVGVVVDDSAGGNFDDFL